MRKVGVICGVAFVCLAGATTPALAADTFVDQATGDDGNDCTSAGAPCASVQAGIDKAGAGDTVRVAPGDYAAPSFAIRIGDGKSLIATGSAAATSLETLYVEATGAGRVAGFTMVGDAGIDANGAVRIMGTGTVEDNVFAAADAISTALRVDFGAGSAIVRDNAFGDEGTDTATALSSSTSGSPEISGNTIDGFTNGISITRGTATIRRNTLEHLQNPGAGVGTAIAVGAAGDGDTAPILTGNVVRDPVSVGGLNPVPAGISIGTDLNAAAPTTGATLRRNQIIGHNPGVTVTASDGAVTLESDLIVGAPDGISAFENAPAPAGSDLGDFSATNVTVVGGSRALVLQEVHATLDSSIVSDSINDSVGAQTSCTITNSRGTEVGGPGTNGCSAGDFSTNADPQFVNSPADPGSDDFHLQPSSPMIDAGNPADPGPGALDVDGDPRALPGTCGAAVRRDIGADEFARDCSAPNTQIGGTPAAGALTRSRTARLTFSSEAGATFECSVDAAGFAPCSSPLALSGLADGAHGVRVRAKDAAGNIDATPASRNWRVDGTAPETRIDSGPANGATLEADTARFAFSSEPRASFECAVDGGAFEDCASPVELTGLGDGAHEFGVRAADAAGNADATPATRSFTVAQGPPEDRDPPDGEIRKVKVKGDDAKVKFRSDEPGSTFECRLDRKRFKPCTSPKRYRNLEDGKHRVRVIASDPAGNEGAVDKAKFRVR